MADLLTSADVEQYLAVTLTAAQTALLDDQILPAISQYARNFCNRDFDASGTITETFDGGQDTYFVKQIPVASIVQITDTGSIIDPGSYYNYSHYIKLDGKASSGNLNVEIQYTSNNTIPDDLVGALVRWGAKELNDSGEGTGMVSEDEIRRFTAGSVTVEYKDDGDEIDQVYAKGVYIPAYVYDVLKRYRLDPK